MKSFMDYFVNFINRYRLQPKKREDKNYIAILSSDNQNVFFDENSQYLFFFLHHIRRPLIYALSLHDALPICRWQSTKPGMRIMFAASTTLAPAAEDRKSTRLNSSHLGRSYAVICMKKKTEGNEIIHGLLREFYQSLPTTTEET